MKTGQFDVARILALRSLHCANGLGQESFS
jgi:hypothetical protein